MKIQDAAILAITWAVFFSAASLPQRAVAEVIEPEAPADLADLGLDDELDFDLGEFDIFDEFALLAAEDFVVSASRRRQRIQESPSAITVITREQILASGYDNLLDLMRLVPGADVYRVTQGTGSMGLRSNSDWAGENLLVLVDGRDVALHLFGLPLWMGMPFDMDTIERVEVIRGPGSTLYGANALQGVINIVTRDPGQAPLAAEATASAAGLNTTSMDFRVHGRKGDWGYWANAGWDRRAPYALPSEVDSEIFRGRMLVDWHGSKDLSLRLESGLVHINGRLTSFMGDGPVTLFWPYLLSRLSIAGTEVVALVDWNDSTMDMDFGLVLPDETDGAVLARAPLLEFPTRSAELTAHRSFDLFGLGTLMVGGSARAIHHMKGAIVDCPITTIADFDPAECVPADVVEMRLGLFVQNEWFLHKNLLLNLGGRLDHNSLNTQPGFSPRAALVYSHPVGHAVRLGYGRSYRKPTYAETDLAILLVPDPSTPEDLGRRIQHLFSQVGQRDLLNEYMDSIELGLRGRFFEDRLSVTLDTFVAAFSHHIISIVENLELTPGFAGVPTLPDDAFVGIGNQRHGLRAYGGELQVSGKPASWLTLSGTYSLDRMFDPEIDEVTGELEWLLSKDWEPHHRLFGSIRFATGPFRAGLDAFWFSRYLTDTRDPESVLKPRIINSVGATTLVNGHLSYRLTLATDRSVEFGMSVLNLLDQPYREVGGVDQDGRVLGGGELMVPRGRLFVRGQF